MFSEKVKLLDLDLEYNEYKVDNKINSKEKNSFVEGTLILTNKGKIPIELIKVGQKGHRVLTKNPSSGEMEIEEVKSKYESTDSNLYTVSIGEEEFTCTGDHQFWINDSGWKKIKLASIGDRLLTKNNESVYITNIKPLNEEKVVYDFTPNINDTYFIGELEILTNSGKFKSAHQQSVVNLLSSFKSVNKSYGNKTFLIDKRCIKHILERHHPTYHSGKLDRSKNSFLNKDLRVEDIITIIEHIMQQNRSLLIRKGQGIYQIRGKFNDVDYILGINNGRVGQLYPLY